MNLMINESERHAMLYELFLYRESLKSKNQETDFIDKLIRDLKAVKIKNESKEDVK